MVHYAIGDGWGELLNLPEHTFPVVGACLGYRDPRSTIETKITKEMMFLKEIQYQPLAPQTRL